MTARILVAEDEKLLRWSLADRLTQEGYEVVQASEGQEALELARKQDIDLVLLDYRLPDMNGLEVLEQLSAENDDLVAVLMTAYSTVDSAVKAMKLGAYDYINKPFDLDELVLILAKGLETTALRREVRQLRAQLKQRHGVENVIGKSQKMIEVFNLVERIADSGSTTVLLEGESGTGKGLIARAIHERSRRAERPFMTITCSALPESLLESELFGHERGAFTDAKDRKLGLLQLADGGTVFLDEIAEIPLSTQAKLLRVLEDKVFMPVGGTSEVSVDVRIVAATNRDLVDAVSAGEFRPDLYYRLKVVPIHMPPLRERQEDVALLAMHFVDHFKQEFRRTVNQISPAAMRLLGNYQWPGNVRELRNVIERAMLLGSGAAIDVEELPIELRQQRGEFAAAAHRQFALPPEGLDFELLEKDLVRQALSRTQGNQTRAADLLGMNRDQIRYRIEKFDLQGNYTQ